MLVCFQSHNEQNDGAMRLREKTSGDYSDGNERLNPSILAYSSNFSTSLNSTSVISLFISLHLLTSSSRTAKRELFMTFDSSLGGWIMKSKTDPSFGYIAFFTYTWVLVFSSNLSVPIIRKENVHLFAMLLIIIKPPELFYERAQWTTQFEQYF